MLIKDMSLLLETRSQDSIVVVDFDEKQVDEDVSVLALPEKYDGSNNYQNLRALKQAVKSIVF